MPVTVNVAPPEPSGLHTGLALLTVPSDVASKQTGSGEMQNGSWDASLGNAGANAVSVSPVSVAGTWACAIEGPAAAIPTHAIAHTTAWRGMNRPMTTSLERR